MMALFIEMPGRLIVVLNVYPPSSDRVLNPENVAFVFTIKLPSILRFAVSGAKKVEPLPNVKLPRTLESMVPLAVIVPLLVRWYQSSLSSGAFNVMVGFSPSGKVVPAAIVSVASPLVDPL